MTLIEMRDITRQYERAYGRRRHHSETITDDTSDAVAIPMGVEEVAVAVSPGTDALVQYTLSTYAAIEADTATWRDWPGGTVTTDTDDVVLGSVTALRMTSTGASIWEVTA